MQWGRSHTDTQSLVSLTDYLMVQRVLMPGVLGEEGAIYLALGQMRGETRGGLLQWGRSLMGVQGVHDGQRAKGPHVGLLGEGGRAVG